VLIVDRKSARYIDCKNLALPFGPQFVEDVVSRTRCRKIRRPPCYPRTWF